MDAHECARRKLAAALLGRAEVELRATQAVLQADDSNENRARYARAVEELKAAEQAAQAALNGWRELGEA